MKLQGKVAMISGGSKGLGADLARRFVEEGASVSLCARRPESADALAAELRAAGGRCLVGQMKYIYSIDGCMVVGDEVPVEDRNYYVFMGTNDGNWLLRAA